MDSTTHPSEIKALIALLQSIVGKWNGRLGKSPPSVESRIVDELAGAVRRLKRSAAEFDSKLFILLVFGPLKSGKSTLVNCMVGSELSPTALGISTTKRPSIMLASVDGKESAEQFFEADRKPHKRLRTFESVIDYLRGLNSREELARVVEVKPLGISGVTEELRREPQAGKGEPLLTAIHLAATSFTRAGVAIMDSPGLDDPAAIGPHEKTALDWAVAEADFCVLVHSSLAAPNEKMLGFIADVLTKHSAPPLMVLQNRFEARLWRRQEVSDAENFRQQQDTRSRIHESLGDAASKVLFRELHANLGLAADKRFRHTEVDPERQQKLQLQDGLEAVEDDILDLLKGSRESLKRAATINRLKHFLEPEGEGDAVIKSCRENARSIRARYEDEVHELESAEKEAAQVNHSTDDRWFLPLEKLVKTQRELWLKSLLEAEKSVDEKLRGEYGTGESDLMKVKFRDQIPGSEVNEKALTMTREVLLQFGRAVFDVSSLFGDSLAKELMFELRRTEEPRHASVGAVIQRLGLERLPEIRELARERLPKMELKGVMPAKVSERMWLALRIIEERYNTREAIAHLQKVGKALSERMNEEERNYCKRLRDLFHELSSEARNQLMLHLASQKVAHKLQWQPALAQAEAAMLYAEEFSKDLDSVRAGVRKVKLEPPLGEAAGKR